MMAGTDINDRYCTASIDKKHRVEMQTRRCTALYRGVLRYTPVRSAMIMPSVLVGYVAGRRDGVMPDASHDFQWTME